MEKDYGNKVWFYPDGDMPPEGSDLLKGHESVVILNPNDNDANVKITLYFEDKEPVSDIRIKVLSQRVKCLKTNSLKDMCGVVIPESVQYAMKIESDVPVITQYGRLDARQVNLAYYTTIGYTGCDE